MTKVLEATGGKVTEVEHDGVVYEEIDAEDAGVGDFVWFDESPEDYITSSKLYAIKELDFDNDPQITDDDGDLYDTNGAGTDFTAFREKQAPFTEGDIVVITGNSNASRNKVGDVGKVGASGYGELLRVHVPKRPHSPQVNDNWTLKHEIRPATGEEKAAYERSLQPDTITHEGAEYTKVDRKAQPGDVVYLTMDAEGTAAVPNGNHYEVNENVMIGVSQRWGTYPVYKDRYNRTEDTVIVYEPAAAASADPREAFAKGDTVRLIAGGGQFPLNGFRDGRTYEVKNPFSDAHNGNRIEILDESDEEGYALPEQIEKVAVQTAPKFVPGDIITAPAGSPYAWTDEWMTRGEVVEGETLVGDDIRVKILEHSTMSKCVGRDYSVNSKHFKYAKAREGDTVEMLSDDDEWGDYKKGERFKVYADEVGDMYIVDNDEDRRFLHLNGGIEYKVVHAADSDDRNELKVGDYAEVLNNRYGYGGKVGSIVKLIATHGINSFKTENADGSRIDGPLANTTQLRKVDGPATNAVKVRFLNGQEQTLTDVDTIELHQ